MRTTFQYTLAVAFVMFTLIPIRSYDRVEDKSMHLGVVIGLALNLFFFFQLDTSAGLKRFHSWHLPIAFYFPVLLACTFLLAVVVSKGLLRGSTPLNKWGIDQAKILLRNDKNVFHRILARMLIAATPPMLLFFGWGLCSSVFVKFVFHNH